MGMISMPGTPFYVNGTENCFFPSGGPGFDPTSNVPATLYPNGTVVAYNSTLQEFVEPTNSTNTDPLFGDQTVLNNFFDTVDQAAKSMELLKHVISGGYIMDTINHFTISCSFNETGHIITEPEHPVWTNLKEGINVLITLLMVFTLFYWATGRGHILTS
jgi:hypothetical protein